MKKYISFHSYSISENEKRELLDTLDSGWITTGSKTKRFEDQFAKYVKAKYAIGVSSGTAALHLSLLALGIGKGDEVITTPLTFVATVNAIRYVGARPVFADVEPETLNINPQQIMKKINKKTKAIIPVHYAGQPCKMEEITKIANKNGLFIIEDAAHAIEAKSNGRKIGSISDLTCFSFHPIKNITTGEGGMITTNNKKLSDRLRIYSWHGLDKEAQNRYKKGQFKYYDMFYLGYKYNMTDIQASLGIHQLKKIDAFWGRRKRYSEIYDSILKGHPNILTLPSARKGDKNSYHLYPIRVKTENLTIARDEVINRIQKKNIGVSVHFQCVHLFSFYKKCLNYPLGSFPIAEYASERLISLPLYPKLTEEEVVYVAKTTKQIINKAQRRR